MERAEPPRDRREELTGGVERSPTRCPYCHDSIRAEDLERAVVCGQCLARHHPECWDGHCGACAGTTALGRLDVPARPATSILYERLKIGVNVAWCVAFCLYFVLMFAGLVASSVRRAGVDAFPLEMIPGIIAGMFSVFLCFPMIAINSYDAIVRRDRSHVSALAIGLALGGLVTGGMATFAYFVVWGRHPLAPAKTKKAGPPKDAKA